MKTSSLGDVVHHCPAVSDAARRHRGIEIDWVVEEAFAGVPAMHTGVRRVIPVALRRWRRSFWSAATRSEYRAFRETLSRDRYDRVIDTQGLLKSAWLCRLADAAEIHGFDRASAREPLAALFYGNTHRVEWKMHAVDRNRRLAAAALGYPIDDALDYGLSAKRDGAHGDRPYVFLTMTAREEKLWPEERWIALGKALQAPILLPWGSEAERARVERIAAAVPRAAVATQMTLREVATVLAGARGVIGVDTGLTHLAAALEVPSLAIFCGTEPGLYGLRGSARVRNVGDIGRIPSVEEVLKELA